MGKIKVYQIDHVAAWYWLEYIRASNRGLDPRPFAIKWADALDKSTDAENR